MFVIVASIYLYGRRTKEPKPSTRDKIKTWARDFVFVWLLLGLLVLYVVSVGEGSYLLFAIGNVVVEILLLVYVLKSSGYFQQPSSSGVN